LQKIIPCHPFKTYHKEVKPETKDGSYTFNVPQELKANCFYCWTILELKINSDGQEIRLPILFALRRCELRIAVKIPSGFFSVC
jgi:hypothetical protein